MNEPKLQIELSVIVCTRNRARQLATLIQCLGLQKNIENLNWEIIIVDNNSNDNTKEVAYAFCEGSNLKINYIFEPRIGLACARNAGVLASKGSYLLFVDDDVLVPKEFLSNVLFGIQEFPEFQIFGFRILPDWQGINLPFWLTFKKPFNLIQSFLPVHDLGKETLQYPNRIAKNPIGACFLVRKEVFEKVGPFREDLGAGQSGVCEDTEFFWYSIINNFKILYWPYAALYHPVDPERLTVRYLHKWYFNLGKSLYLIKSGGRIASLQGAPGFHPGRRSNLNYILWLKLSLLILFLPLTIVLLFFKRPFYLSTMVAKTIGEIWKSLNLTNLKKI